MEFVKPTTTRESKSITSYILSIFNTYFDNNATATEKSKPQYKYIKNGSLLPHSPTRKTDAYITPQTVTAPIGIVGDTNDDDCWDYLSKSDSSTCSSGSSFSSISALSSSDHLRRQRRSISSLSGILCEHYVQKTLNSNSESTNIDVPLETYKVFEATRRRSSSSSGSNSSVDLSEADDDDDSWFIWDNLQEVKEWIQVVDEEVFLPKETVTTEITLVEKPNNRKSRGIRANPAHLRMIVLEVNMMRLNKIVGPLKSRGFLPVRSDTYVSNQSSPLKLPIC